MNTLTPRDDDEMSPDEEDEYEFCLKETIDDLERASKHLNMIRTKKLYRHKYKTWQLFCQGELGITRQWAAQIEKSAVAIEEVTCQLSRIVAKNDKSSKAAKKTLEFVPKMSVEAGAELHKVEPEKRPEVLASSIVNGEPPTAAAIREAAKPKPAAPEEPAVVVDNTGYPVPAHRIALFNRHVEIDVLLEKISEVRCVIRREMDAGKNADILYAHTSLSGLMKELNAAYGSLYTAIPWVVCPDCQGQRSGPCMSCKGRGFLSKHMWDATVCREHKELRALTVSKMKRDK